MSQTKIDTKLNPIDFYNEHHQESAIGLILHKYPNSERANEVIVIRENNTEYIVYIHHGYFETEDTVGIFSAKQRMSPFAVLTSISFKGNFEHAMAYVQIKLMNQVKDYIRVGITYYKKVTRIDHYGVPRTELARWVKQEIVEDHRKIVLSQIPKLDGFTLEPSNTNFQQIISGHYNLYHPFAHKPKRGEFKWTQIMMKHIFGEEPEKLRLGYQYMQCLYLHPKQALPVLTLTSVLRQTGKSTFINFLAMLFSHNFCVVSPQDIESQFNGLYSRSNIIAIEEATTERKQIVEKLKMLSTAKQLTVNQKHVDTYPLPFFGHFIVTSNSPDAFMHVDNEEIRFFIRVLTAPKFFNANIEDDLLKEIPAFLDYLLQMPPLDFSKSRMLFTPEEIATDQLEIVKANSRSWLYKEIMEELGELFANNPDLQEVSATPKDMKEMFWTSNNRVEIGYIRKVMKTELNWKPVDKATRYTTVGYGGALLGAPKIGRPYVVTRDMIK